MFCRFAFVELCKSPWSSALRVGLLWSFGGLALAVQADASAARGLHPEQNLGSAIHRHWVDVLPSPQVRALAKTPDGGLWVGTAAGLVRFDGRVFETWCSHAVRSLTVDRAGVLWIGTENNGLLRLEGRRLRRFGPGDGLPSRRVNATTLDDRGRLVVATPAGVLLFAQGSFEPLFETPEPVIALAAAGTRLFGVTTSHLLVHQNGHTETYAADSAEGPRRFTAVAVGQQDEVYVAGDQGLLVFAAGSFSDPFAGKGPRGVLALRPDDHGALWLGTFAGAFRTIPARARIEPFLPPHVLATAVVADFLPDGPGVDGDPGGGFGGSVFLATLDAGLHLLRDNPLRIYSDREGLSSPLLTSVAEDAEGNLWATSRQGGLDRLDPRSGRIDNVEGLPDKDLWSVAIDRQGTWWLGSNSRGLLRGRPGGTWQSFGVEQGLPTHLVQVVRPGRDGTLWAATDQGLVRLDGETLRVFTRADGLPSNTVRDIYEDRAGRVLVATMGGLAVYLGDDRFSTFVPTAGAAPEGVLSIWEDEKGALWLATLGGLVQVENGRTRSLTTLDGLVSDDLSCAIGDRYGFLWIATAKGLLRVALSELRERLETRQGQLHPWLFDRRGGLAAGISNNGTASLASTSGRLYFASRGGLVEVAADRLSPLPAPPIRLDEVQQKALPWWRSLTPATAGSSLHFRFSAITLAAPDAFELRYRLEGFDHDWQYAPQSSEAHYNRVPPGKYRFLLAASDQEGRFAPTPTLAREVVVAERQALTWLIRLSVFAAVAAVLLLAHRFRIRLLERREAELQRQVDRALDRLEALGGMLPICSFCKKVRDDRGYWEEIESYIHSHSALEFERGSCPECELAAREVRQSSGRVVRIARAISGESP